MKPKIYRFGREFFIDGHRRPAATIEVRNHFGQGPMEFEVNYGTRGADSPEVIEPYAEAILAACKYAKRCRKLFKGKTYTQIRDIWLDEYIRDGKVLVDAWEAIHQAARAATSFRSKIDG